MSHASPVNGENPHLPLLRKRVAKAPVQPGVYRWLDADGTVLYVGKAKNIRNRLRNYVAPGKTGHGPWRLAFLRQIADFNVTVTNTELEALMLETNLIKEMKPKYNVLMKDDKNYLYVRIDLRTAYPRIETVRKWQGDGAKYFGPYTHSDRVNGILALLRKLHGYRTCKMGIAPLEAGTSRIPLQVECTNRDRPTPCLDHHIGQCTAPCIGQLSPQDYRAQCIDPVLEFLSGKTAATEALVRERMQKAALEKQFELAAQYRDALQVILREQESQLAIDATGEDADVLGMELLSERAYIVILHRRIGRIIGEAHYALPATNEDGAELLTQFITQFYSEHEIPPALLIGLDLPSRKDIEAWLSERRGTRVRVDVPERGRKSHLVELAEKNAHGKAEQEAKRWEAEERNRTLALQGLQENLRLSRPPKRIEAYDISHFAGSDTVGSMVVGINGEAQSDQYRSFTMKSLGTGDIDDYKSLQEMLRRRLKYLHQDLRAQIKERAEQGWIIEKARKADQESLLALSKEHGLADDDLTYRDYLVVRHADTIVGFCRMITYDKNIRTIRSLWVHADHRQHHLGHLLVRSLVQRAKSGKVYLICKPELHDYYGEIGFEPVHTPPPILAQKITEWQKDPAAPPLTVFVYIFARHKTDASLESRPDLIVIDGGKGQLNAVCAVLREAGMDLPIIGLAKREEEVFVPGRSEPVIFRQDSPAKFLLMRLRDEAHRFSNRHREKRAKTSLTKSALTDIPGIGEKTMLALLKKFGSLAAAQAADDLQLIDTLNRDQLAAFRSHTQQPNDVTQSSGQDE